MEARLMGGLEMTYLVWWALEGSEMAVFAVACVRCPGCVCVDTHSLCFSMCVMCVPHSQAPCLQNENLGAWEQG